MPGMPGISPTVTSVMNTGVMGDERPILRAKTAARRAEEAGARAEEASARILELRTGYSAPPQERAERAVQRAEQAVASLQEAIQHAAEAHAAAADALSRLARLQEARIGDGPLQDAEYHAEAARTRREAALHRHLSESPQMEYATGAPGVAGLTVSSYHDGDMAVVSLAGELDATNVAAVLAMLSAHFDSGCEQMVLDVARLTFCDSRGLRMMLDAKRAASDGGGGWLRLAGPTGVLRHVLDMTGLVNAFPIYADVADAL